MRRALVTVAAAAVGAVLAFIVALAVAVALLAAVGRDWIPTEWVDTTMRVSIFFAWFAAPPIGAAVVGIATYRALGKRTSVR